MDMKCFLEIHHDIPREGPGTNAITRRAYSYLENLPENPRILDIGCGPGKQTIELAKLSRGQVTAIDLHQPYLETLRKNAANLGLRNIEILNCSMDDLPCDPESIDVIWGEGSIYIMGFKKGLRYLRSFLKPSGYLAVSEITWLKHGVPEICKTYWEKNYDEMYPIEEKERQIREAGYEPVRHFILPKESWWTEYYSYILKRIEKIEAGKVSREMREVLRLEIEEMDMHRKYSEYYGYVFYIMRK